MKKSSILILIIFSIATLKAQNYLIHFAATGLVSTLDSVKIENLNQSTFVTINGNDTLQLSGTLGINNKSSIEENIMIRPNPMQGEAELLFYANHKGNVQLIIYDITGKIIFQTESNINQGTQKFKLSDLPNGTFFVSIKGEDYFYKTKLLSFSSSFRSRPKIEYVSDEYKPIQKTENNMRQQISMLYNTGDSLRYIGYSSNLNSNVLDVPISSKLVTFNFVNIVLVAQEWLTATGNVRDSLGNILDAWVGNIDSIIQLVKPHPTNTQTGEIFYQNFTNPLFQTKYPNHQFHMYVPTHYNPSIPMGVIVWMHGGGSWAPTEIDHLAQFDMDNEQFTSRSYPRTETDASNYILIAPLAPFGNVIPHPQHASRWNVPNAEQYIIDVITELSTRYHVDFNRVVLAGFSMGGIGAYHMALRLNDRVAAVMASAGSWKLGSWSSLVAPLYIIHGTYDAYWSPSGCRAHFTPIENALLTKTIMGNNCVMVEYPDGHSWDNIAQQGWATFINGQSGWVTNKVRDPYRNNVKAINPWRSYDVGSNFNVSWTENPSIHTSWISIYTIGTGQIMYDFAKRVGDGGCSSQAAFNNWALLHDSLSLNGGKAEATISGNTIVVTSTNVTKMSLWLHPNMLDFNSPVQVILNGNTTSYNLSPSLLTALKSYERRWDWSMIYHAEITIVQ